MLLIIPSQKKLPEVPLNVNEFLFLKPLSRITIFSAILSKA